MGEVLCSSNYVSMYKLLFDVGYNVVEPLELYPLPESHVA